MRARTRIRTSSLEPVKKEAKASVTKEIIEWVITLGLAVGLALCVHMWVGELITVDGPSMEPNLWKDEKVVVGRVEYYFAKPKRGDIVIVRYPDRTDNIIKRVIAVGGERISISNSSVYINGKKLTEPYLKDQNFAGELDEQTVPEGYIFVMGDNRDDSHDSRNTSVGPVPLSEVKGRAYSIVWPLDKWSKLTEYKGTMDP